MRKGKRDALCPFFVLNVNIHTLQEDELKRKRTAGWKEFLKNPLGHYRKRPDASEFGKYFERCGDAAVLVEFLNSTATWVQENFSSIELEVHQAASLGRAAREENQNLDHEKVKAHFPRLAILATDGDMQEILESTPKPKEVTAGMLSRVLHREESSIMRWARGKK